MFESRREFGMTILSPVFVNKNLDGEKTMFDNVRLATKQQIEREGGVPHAAGVVAGTYVLQLVLENAIRGIFGEELLGTHIYLFDNRQSVEPQERLLAVYDPLLKSDEAFTESMRLNATTMQALTDSCLNSQTNVVEASGTDMSFAIVVCARQSYFDAKSTHTPYLILLISVALVLVAQIERWLGHPVVLSSERALQSVIEGSIRDELECKIVRESSRRASEAFQFGKDADKYAGN